MITLMFFGRVFHREDPPLGAAMLNSTKEPITLKITERSSACTKRTEN